MRRWLFVAALGTAVWWWGAPASAVIPEAGEPQPTRDQPARDQPTPVQPARDPALSNRQSVVAGLADPDRSRATLEALLARRDAESVLREIAASNVDISARGWAVVGLTRLPGDPSPALQVLVNDGAAPQLVRTWAMAALVARAPDLGALAALAQQQYAYPGLDRPVDLRARQLLANAPVDALLLASADATLQPLVVPLLLSVDEDTLVRLTYTDTRDGVRRQAAAFSASRGQSPNSRVASLVLQRLAFTRGRMPWAGGALYVPALAWSGADGKELLHTLMVWYLHCSADPALAAEGQQVWNNLYSYQLLTANGYQMNLQAERGALIAAVERVEGKGVAQELLARAGRSGSPRLPR